MANWFKMYNFEDNEERTIKVLNKFGIEKYHFVADNGTLALLIEKGLNSYRIELNDYDNEMLVLKKQVRRKAQRHTKEYMRIVARFDNDCIYNSIRFCALDNE